jgi:hypothetical protein
MLLGLKTGHTCNPISCLSVPLLTVVTINPIPTTKAKLVLDMFDEGSNGYSVHGAHFANVALDDVIDSHACSLEARACV